MHDLFLCMPMKAKISINMIVYNGQDYLEETLASIFAQTFTDYELIIVDDGSTDETPLILEQAKSDQRVKVITNVSNMGRPFSRNRALMESKGQLIAIADADDWLFPERLEKQYKFMTANPKITVCGSFMRIYGTDELLTLAVEHDHICTYFLFANHIFNPTVMFRRLPVLHFANAYDERFLLSQDYDLWERLAQHPEIKFANLRDVLVRYRINTIRDNQKYYSRQDDFAHLIRMRQIASLGLKTGHREEILHKMLCGNIPITNVLDIESIYQWIEDIRNANRKVKRYNQKMLNIILTNKIRGLDFVCKEIKSML